jgi:DNA polymerase III epsilon subunit-like protein
MIVVDIEGSGTENHIHSIVSIGAVDFDNPKNRFYQECRIWEGAHIMDGALEVNGFTEAQITDSSKKSEAEIVTEFIEWSFAMNDRTLVGQNVSFDRDFLKAAAQRAKIAWNLPYRTLDTHTMCWMHMVKAGKEVPIDAQHRRSLLDLDAVLQYCGIVEEPHPHNALTGALCHAEVTSRLLYDKKLLPEFSQYEIPWLSIVQ